MNSADNAQIFDIFLFLQLSSFCIQYTNQHRNDNDVLYAKNALIVAELTPNTNYVCNVQQVALDLQRIS